MCSSYQYVHSNIPQCLFHFQRKAQDTVSRRSMFPPACHNDCPPPSRQSLTTPTEKPSAHTSSSIMDSGQAKDNGAALRDKVPKSHNPNTSNPNQEKTHTPTNEADSSTAENNSGLELKPDDVETGHISVSVVHVDSSIAREHDTEATEESGAVSARSTNGEVVKNLMDVQKGRANAVPAKRSGRDHGDYTFLTTTCTLDSGLRYDAVKMAETTRAENLATEQTTEIDSGSPTDTQDSAMATQSGVKNGSSTAVHEYGQGMLLGTGNETEPNTDPNLEFRIVDVSHNTAQLSANPYGGKAPNSRKR